MRVNWKSELGWGVVLVLLVLGYFSANKIGRESDEPFFVLPTGKVVKIENKKLDYLDVAAFMMIDQDGRIRPVSDVPFDMPEDRPDIEFPELNVLDFNGRSIFFTCRDLILQDLNRHVVAFRLGFDVGTPELNLAAFSVPDSGDFQKIGDAKGGGFSCAEHAPARLALLSVDVFPVHLEIPAEIVPAHAAAVIVDRYALAFHIDMDIDGPG